MNQTRGVLVNHHNLGVVMESKDLVDLISKKLFRIEGLETRINMDSDSSNFLCPHKDKCNVVVGKKIDKMDIPNLLSHPFRLKRAAPSEK